MNNEHKSHNPVSDALIVTGVLGPVVFVSIFVVLGFISFGYSPVSQVISELELYNYGLVQVANFIISGSLLMAFSIGFYKTTQGVIKKGTRTAAAILLIFGGVGLILGGVFITDPTGPNVTHTSRGVLHVIGGFMAFAIPPPVAFIIVGLALPKVHYLRAFRIYSVCAGVATYALLALFVFASGNTQLGSNHTIGIFNRIATIEALAWYAVAATNIWSLAHKHTNAAIKQTQ